MAVEVGEHTIHPTRAEWNRNWQAEHPPVHQLPHEDQSPIIEVYSQPKQQRNIITGLAASVRNLFTVPSNLHGY